MSPHTTVENTTSCAQKRKRPPPRCTIWKPTDICHNTTRRKGVKNKARHESWNVMVFVQTRTEAQQWHLTKSNQMCTISAKIPEISPATQLPRRPHRRHRVQHENRKHFNQSHGTNNVTESTQRAFYVHKVPDLKWKGRTEPHSVLCCGPS